MENLFEKAEKLAKQGKYLGLATLVSEMESIGCLHPELLTLKSQCLQTTVEPVSVSLEDFQKSLKDAIALDETYFPAYVELAYFQLNVMDNAEEALPLFEKAIEIINRTATEAILGKALCVAELKSKEEAMNYIEQSRKDLIEGERMKEFLVDVETYAS